MIQRIQTVYLSLAVLINLSIFFSPIYRHALNDPSGWIGTTFAGFLTVAMVLSFVSIFLYGNRVNQIKWVKAASYFQIAALGIAIAILFTLGGFGRFLWEEVVSTALLVLALVLLWMAGRRIKKDQELVDSMDRIR
ncbi:DUF4293 family protein [Rhodohalobacter sp. 8-1]|uniref:DUF4293 family protein n=1 Tax=Rhodohalobacter sp. 8-1 TaxID=3131972 RepID=UPI0030EB3405